MLFIRSLFQYWHRKIQTVFQALAAHTGATARNVHVVLELGGKGSALLALAARRSCYTEPSGYNYSVRQALSHGSHEHVGMRASEPTERSGRIELPWQTASPPGEPTLVAGNALKQ